MANGYIGGFGWTHGSVYTQDVMIGKDEKSFARNASKLENQDELALFSASYQFILLYEMLAFDGFFPNNLSDEPTQESVLQLITEYQAWRKLFCGDFLVLDPRTTKICYRPGQAIFSGLLGLAGIFKGLCASPFRFRFDFFQAIVRDPIQLMEFGRRLDRYSLPYARSFNGFTAQENAVFKLLFTGRTGPDW
jgi:hypothetical protein